MACISILLARELLARRDPGSVILLGRGLSLLFPLEKRDTSPCPRDFSRIITTARSGAGWRWVGASFLDERVLDSRLPLCPPARGEQIRRQHTEVLPDNIINRELSSFCAPWHMG
jgi:hypothetical protein